MFNGGFFQTDAVVKQNNKRHYLISGPWIAGDAFGNWKNDITSLFDCSVHDTEPSSCQVGLSYSKIYAC